MQRILNNITSIVLILLILCIQSLSTFSIFNVDADLNLIELAELAEETEESKESDEKNLEEDSEEFVISKDNKSCVYFYSFGNKSDRFISLYKSLCLDIKGAPPDIS